MPLAIVFFLIQLAIAIVTVLVVTRLYGALRGTSAKGDTLILLGASIIVLLLLSARGLFVASASLESDAPGLTGGDWLLTLTGVVTLVVFAAYGRVLHSRAELEKSIRDLSATDSVTGMFSKGAFMTMASPLVLAARRYRHPLSAIIIDIDHLTRINDEFGRKAGDESLRAFGGVVGGCLRTIDVAGRLTSEKFAIVLPHTDLQGAALVAERICAAVDRDIKLIFEERQVHLSVSIGVATLHDGNLENLLNIADGVMYSAKENGRNQVGIEAVA